MEFNPTAMLTCLAIREKSIHACYYCFQSFVVHA
jgi:hypothetical protein